MGQDPKISYSSHSVASYIRPCLLGNCPCLSPRPKLIMQAVFLKKTEKSLNVGNFLQTLGTELSHRGH